MSTINFPSKPESSNKIEGYLVTYECAGADIVEILDSRDINALFELLTEVLPDGSEKVVIEQILINTGDAT